MLFKSQLQHYVPTRRPNLILVRHGQLWVKPSQGHAPDLQTVGGGPGKPRPEGCRDGLPKSWAAPLELRVALGLGFGKGAIFLRKIGSERGSRFLCEKSGEWARDYSQNNRAGVTALC